MSSSHVDKIAEIHRQIGTVLLQDWDPIGLAHVPQAHDEYYSYVRGVYDVAIQTHSAQAVTEHLAKIERETIGLFPGFRRWKRLLPVAQKIVDLTEKL